MDEQTREATRRRIIREAASEFARLGFEQANINTIAEQAGIGLMPARASGHVVTHNGVQMSFQISSNEGWLHFCGAQVVDEA